MSVLSSATSPTLFGTPAALREAEASARRAYALGHDDAAEYQMNVSLLFLGLTLLARGNLYSTRPRVAHFQTSGT